MFESDSQLQLSCASKLAFATREEAQAAATTAMHRYGGKLKVYQCQECGRWHISSGYN